MTHALRNAAARYLPPLAGIAVAGAVAAAILHGLFPRVSEPLFQGRLPPDAWVLAMAWVFLIGSLSRRWAAFATHRSSLKEGGIEVLRGLFLAVQFLGAERLAIMLLARFGLQPILPP